MGVKKDCGGKRRHDKAKRKRIYSGKKIKAEVGQSRSVRGWALDGRCNV